MEKLNVFVILLVFILKISSIVSVLPQTNKYVCTEKENQPKNKTKSEQLKEHLLCDYDKTVRPVVTKNSTDLTFILIAEEVDYTHYSYYASLSTSIVLMWVDEHLSWDPYDFDKIRKVQLTPDEIWTPDLAIYNKGQYGSKKVIQGSKPCNVHYNKQVLCLLESKLTAMCIPDLRFWPHDEQKCTLKIGSWYHVGSEINFSFVRVNKNDENLYDKSNEWILKNMTIKVNPGVINGLNDTFPTVLLEFTVQRNNKNSFLTFLLPYLVLVIVTFMTLCFDPTSSDRIHFAAFNIPCQILFLTSVLWELPMSPSVPFFVLGLRNSNTLVSIILIETLVVRHFFSKTDPSPTWLITTITKITENPVGKFWLYFELNGENLKAEILEDIGRLGHINKKPSDWYLFGRIIDKSLFILTCIFYFISIVILL